MAVRKQSGCVVFRYDRNFDYEILLVKSSDGKDWVFPKGGVEKHLTPKQSAAKEVYEEAGVAGRILSTLGKYEYQKQGKDQKVTMYAMMYERDTDDWPEKHLRKRKWFKIKDAKKKLPKLLKPFLDELKQANMLALSSSNVMDQVGQHLRELPVLVDHAGEVEVSPDESVQVVLANGEDRLTMRIEDWGQHPLSQKMTIHYDYEHEGREGKHFKHTSLQGVAGDVARIAGRFLSGHLAMPKG
ncbi:nudix hydrolase [Pseudomonas phage PaBG]|uniref:NUDIX hydrolase n=1 Tax=Pseudomonas phage PaBG TaxID=1335230 RepID=S5VVF8_9CAUD|nr:nudix hydrolase [Pseudomonas phage PaBG]AGS82152.1 nucleoside triphosphate pyrophosphorylase [Pseudomonas phage PaBG]